MARIVNLWIKNFFYIIKIIKIETSPYLFLIYYKIFQFNKYLKDPQRLIRKITLLIYVF